MVCEAIEGIWSPALVEVTEEGGGCFPVVEVYLFAEGVGRQVEVSWNPDYVEVDMIFLASKVEVSC